MSPRAPSHAKAGPADAGQDPDAPAPLAPDPLGVDPMAPDPLAVDIEEIPLPPEELWPELNNETGAKPADAGAAPAPEPEREVATLTFVGGKPREVAIDLDFPFEWDGRRVDRVTVRRLTVAELGQVVDALPASGGIDNFDIYAAMTGLAAPVLRGMDTDDGRRVTEAAYDFLPRIFRAANPA